MLVAEVVNGIKAGSEFTFDYLLLVVLASIIAFFGLLENSSVVLVASMLVLFGVAFVQCHVCR